MSTIYTGTAGAQSGPGLTQRRIGRLLGYGLLGLVGLLLVLLASGATYEAIASRQAARRYRAPGHLVDVGGYRLHLHCLGQGSPTVVLDTGLGMPSASWVLVQPVVAQVTRVCAYDRAGYGFSEPGPVPRTSQRIVEEFHALLDRAGEPAPYVLAGHSFGGFTIRLFASRYPSQVAGLVLVDASHEDYATRLHEAGAQTQKQRRRQTQRQIELGLVALRFGLLRLAPTLAGWDTTSATFRRLPPQAVNEMLALFLTPKAIRAAGDELDAFAESSDQLRSAGKLGALPVVVLTAGGRTGDQAGQTAEAAERHRLWRHKLQPELARLSSRGKQIIVDNTDHMIPLEQPEAVIAALRDVIDQSRKSSP